MHTCRLKDKTYEYLRTEAFKQHTSIDEVIAELIHYKSYHEALGEAIAAKELVDYSKPQAPINASPGKNVVADKPKSLLDRVMGKKESIPFD